MTKEEIVCIKNTIRELHDVAQNVYGGIYPHALQIEIETLELEIQEEKLQSAKWALEDCKHIEKCKYGYCAPVTLTNEIKRLKSDIIALEKQLGE